MLSVRDLLSQLSVPTLSIVTWYPVPDQRPVIEVRSSKPSVSSHLPAAQCANLFSVV